MKVRPVLPCRCARRSSRRAVLQGQSGCRSSPRGRCTVPRCHRQPGQDFSRRRTKPRCPTAKSRASAPGYRDANLRCRPCAISAAVEPQLRRPARLTPGTSGWHSSCPLGAARRPPKGEFALRAAVRAHVLSFAAESHGRREPARFPPLVSTRSGSRGLSQPLITFCNRGTPNASPDDTPARTPAPRRPDLSPGRT